MNWSVFAVDVLAVSELTLVCIGRLDVPMWPWAVSVSVVACKQAAGGHADRPGRGNRDCAGDRDVVERGHWASAWTIRLPAFMSCKPARLVPPTKPKAPSRC